MYVLLFLVFRSANECDANTTRGGGETQCREIEITMKDHSLLCLAVNSKKPPKLLCHHPRDLNPPRLSIKNPPPTVRVHLCILSTHGIVMHFVQHGLWIYILPTMAPVDYFSCQYLHRHWHRHWHRHHIRPSHFSMLPPFAICHLPFRILFLFQSR